MAVSEADSAGWMLISTVNLLAAEGETLVEVFVILFVFVFFGICILYLKLSSRS